MSNAISKENRPKYMPTEEEIREACERIQAEWSKVEERKRRPKLRRWTPQQWRTVDFCVG